MYKKLNLTTTLPVQSFSKSMKMFKKNYICTNQPINKQNTYIHSQNFDQVITFLFVHKHFNVEILFFLVLREFCLLNDLVLKRELLKLSRNTNKTNLDKLKLKFQGFCL